MLYLSIVRQDHVVRISGFDSFDSFYYEFQESDIPDFGAYGLEGYLAWLGGLGFNEGSDFNLISYHISQSLVACAYYDVDTRQNFRLDL
jgi:hypothetical protein